ncbi:MAG: hypothetical protein WCJ09_29035 [Planctomycetota bacterium]
MKTFPNDGGGTTLVLAGGDDLSAVPESHRDIISDAVRDAFRDPVAHFSEIATRTTIPNLRNYLSNFIASGRWALLLADTYMMDRATIAAFQWVHPGQHPCMLGLPVPDCDDDRFAPFYGCLSMAHWDSIGFAGGIVSYRKQIPIAAYGTSSTNPTFPADTSTVFGNSSCGDMMVCNSSGDAGYLSHENGASYVIGTLPEMLDWIFGELLQGRTPEFDYSRF